MCRFEILARGILKICIANILSPLVAITMAGVLPNEKCNNNTQYYTAHIVWLDKMTITGHCDKYNKALFFYSYLKPTCCKKAMAHL
jgi:hypothetical protein